MNNYSKIAEAIEYIKLNFKKQPELSEIAGSLNMSVFHFQRIFTEWAGVSPKKFLQFISIDHAKNILNQENSTLSEAAFETGLSGTGRLHDLFINIEAMTPGEYKNGGENLKIGYSFNESLFGKYLVASTEKGICNLFFEEDKSTAIEELKIKWHKAEISETSDSNQLKVKKFFERKSSGKIDLHIRGTEFQLKVWEALLQIPESRLNSYSDIASKVCTSRASRAVGSAIGSNPVAFIIPCHRVIKKTGGIGEYKWGQTRKTAMIFYESNKHLNQTGNQN